MQQLEAFPIFDLDQPQPEAQYLITREELLRLKLKGLVQDKLYVYFALKLTYGTTVANVDIELFCDDWKLTESQLAIAIAQLQKKGALEPKAAQLELELF